MVALCVIPTIFPVLFRYGRKGTVRKGHPTDRQLVGLPVGVGVCSAEIGRSGCQTARLWPFRGVPMGAAMAGPASPPMDN